ncbi:magnesium transporter [Thiosulfativibrio zosterae]|uniref:Magnesium transporter MgtE n=1 Tax=Thiosulfativibrio zosterae TaxID=2675053 RepID=A0A6F8PM87_9GAMM|nr:magnesium transporter [Thiosulfativibrio zosterae]BBP43205.1 magnesium transporter MgtE [Thiosulfativibrio zosterae]
MVTRHHPNDTGLLTEQLLDAINNNNLLAVASLLSRLVPEEISEILEATPPAQRNALWQQIDPKFQGEILAHTNDQVRSSLLDQLEQHEILEVVGHLQTDDIVDIAQSLPETEQKTLLNALSDEDRFAVEIALTYPENTAGGMMSTDFIAVREEVTLEVVMRLLRKIGELPDSLVDLIVRDRDGRYVGTLKLNDLLTHDEDTLVSALVDRHKAAIHGMTPAKEVAHIFEKYDLIAATVVDDKNFVLGRITIDDVVDIIRDQAEHNQMASAGLDEEEDLFSPPSRAAKRRTFWLGINLLTAIFASFVIGLFDASIEKIVALAVLMPIIASMGGIAGTQTATIVIRAISTQKLSQANSKLLILKEATVGLLNGLVWAIMSFAGVFLVFQDWTLGLIFAGAMLINLIAAALAGALIPIGLHRMKIDPALAAGLMLTTVTDSLGFFVFLGLATIIIL